MAEIEFDNVSKRFSDGVEAVRQLDLTVADGEFVILVGPSGCGKSTALRMIAGLEEISEGTLSIGGRVVNHLSPRDRDVAMIFQNYALYPHMTVRANIGFALKLRRRPKAEISRRVEEAAQTLDLEPQLLRKPSQLSGGQRQRVAMGRAIVREPAAFLMDEPLSNLDAKLRVEMRAAISRLQQRLGTTTLYVTHDQTEAMTLGNRVAVMRNGVLQQVDPPRVLYSQPRNVFVAGFIGSPAMNFLSGTLSGDAVDTPIGGIALSAEVRHRLSRGQAAPRDVIVGLRPESFEDARLVPPPQEGHVFQAQVGLTESLGSETYAHLDLAAADVDLADLRELRRDSGTAEVPEGRATGSAIARLSGDSDVQAGQRVPIWVDTAKLHLFDAGSGRSLLHP